MNPTVPSSQTRLLTVLPTPLLSDIVGFLDYESLQNAAMTCTSLRGAASSVQDIVFEMTRRQAEWERMQRTFMKLGYVDGIEDSRELLMQQGFDRGFFAGAHSAFSDGFDHGVVGAAALLARNHSASLLVASHNPLTNADIDQLQSWNVAVNAEFISSVRAQVQSSQSKAPIAVSSGLSESVNVSADSKEVDSAAPSQVRRFADQAIAVLDIAEKGVDFNQARRHPNADMKLPRVELPSESAAVPLQSSVPGTSHLGHEDDMSFLD